MECKLNESDLPTLCIATGLSLEIIDFFIESFDSDVFPKLSLHSDEILYHKRNHNSIQN